jgi:hypothetical protein
MRAARKQGLSHSSLCRWSQSPPLPKRSERDCRGSGGERSAGALRLPGRHSPWNCWQAMTVSNHVVWNRSSKIRVEWSTSKTVGTAAMAMPADPERCWKRVDTAPVGLAVRLIVANSSGGHYLLPYPCKQTAAGWVNAVTGAPLALHPTHWLHHVETLPSIRAWARRLPTPSPTGGTGSS